MRTDQPHLYDPAGDAIRAGVSATCRACGGNQMSTGHWCEACGEAPATKVIALPGGGGLDYVCEGCATANRGCEECGDGTSEEECVDHVHGAAR